MGFQGSDMGDDYEISAASTKYRRLCVRSVTFGVFSSQGYVADLCIHVRFLLRFSLGSVPVYAFCTIPDWAIILGPLVWIAGHVARLHQVQISRFFQGLVVPLAWNGFYADSVVDMDI